jgi:hypothetical protein
MKINCAIKQHLALAILLATGLTGCERMKTIGFDTQGAFGSVSLIDRCADVMRRALPASGLKITEQKVNVDMSTATIEVSGVRSGVEEGGIYVRDVAAQCDFQSGILTSFRWTRGPLRAASAEPAR